MNSKLHQSVRSRGVARQWVFIFWWHIKHIFEDGELHEASVVRFYRTTATDGKSYEVAHYNLEMVLALGFRVRSQAGVRFRQWAISLNGSQFQYNSYHFYLLATSQSK